MNISIIGTGRMGRALLKTLHKSGLDRQLLFTGRDRKHTRQVAGEIAPDVQVVGIEEALQADMIIPTLWFRDLLPWVEEHREALRGKILLDITNPFNDTFDDFTTSYGTSASEELQRLIPQTRVVGAFKNTYWVVFDQPAYGGIPSDVYLTSDFPAALETVREVLKPLPFRFFDAGGLKNNRTIERMTLLSRELALKAGNHPRVSFHLWGV